MRISDWSSDVCSSDLFLSADEFRKRVFGDMEILGEHGIGQPSCDFGDEALVVGNALKKPLDRGFELLRLPAELHVVVQDLPFLIRGDVANIDHHLRLAQQRECILLEIPSRSVVDVVTCCHRSELQSLMRISYAVFCLKKKNKT